MFMPEKMFFIFLLSLGLITINSDANVDKDHTASPSTLTYSASTSQGGSGPNMEQDSIQTTDPAVTNVVSPSESTSEQGIMTGNSGENTFEKSTHAGKSSESISDQNEDAGKCDESSSRQSINVGNFNKITTEKDINAGEAAVIRNTNITNSTDKTTVTVTYNTHSTGSERTYSVNKHDSITPTAIEKVYKFHGNTTVPTFRTTLPTPVESLSFQFDFFQFDWLTQAVVDSLLLQNATQSFLSKFQHGFQQDVIYTQLRYCPYTKLCGFSLDLTPPLVSLLEFPCCKDCACNFPSCLTNKTCCPDVIFSHVKHFDENFSENDLTYFLEGVNIQKDCMQMTLPIQDYSSDNAFVYSTCPSKVDDQLWFNCTKDYDIESISTLDEIIPVVSKETGEVYRNKYCAFCNDVAKEQQENLLFTLTCYSSRSVRIESETDVIRLLFDEYKCKVEFEPQRGHLETCVPSITQCNVTDQYAERACGLYRSIIYKDFQQYQNIFCSMCNGVVHDEFICQKPHSDQTSNLFSFSGVLKLEAHSAPGYKLQAAGKCQENQLYDTITETCKNKTCSIITVLKKEECIDLYDQLRKITYLAYLRLKPTVRMSLFEAYNIADDVIDHMANDVVDSELCNIQMLYIMNTSISRVLDQESNLMAIEIRVKYKETTLHKPSKLPDAILALHNTEHLFKSKEFETNFTLKFELMDTDADKFDRVAFLSDMIYGSVIHGDTDHVDFISNFFTMLDHISNSTDGNFVMVPHLIATRSAMYCGTKDDINILHLTKCPKVQISKHDVPWVNTDVGISLVDGDFVVNSVDYYIDDEDHILVCSDKYEAYLIRVSNPNNSVSFSAEIIVSIVCTSISTLALCLTLCIFLWFPQLRQTIPGKNNMALTLTLILAQSLYMVGSLSGLERNSNECVAMGILIHFSLLAALFWMNICTFHMFRVLSKTRAISTSSGTKRFACYILYVILMSAIFVSINIVTSYFLHGNTGYGLDACYISSQLMVIYTFGIPTGAVVICNMSLFGIVVTIIKRSSEIQTNVKNGRNDLIVFIKLSTITGATWVFGFLYIWTELSLMSYLFILFNASQGVFIMSAFVINKRVFELIKGQRLGPVRVQSKYKNGTFSSNI